MQLVEDCNQFISQPTQEKKDKYSYGLLHELHQSFVSKSKTPLSLNHHFLPLSASISPTWIVRKPS